jgi:hypothetical protein
MVDQEHLQAEAESAPEQSREVADEVPLDESVLRNDEAEGERLRGQLQEELSVAQDLTNIIVQTLLGNPGSDGDGDAPPDSYDQSDAHTEDGLESSQDGRDLTSPSLIARVATWARERTSSLVTMCRTWLSTAHSLR